MYDLLPRTLYVLSKVQACAGCIQQTGFVDCQSRIITQISTGRGIQDVRGVDLAAILRLNIAGKPFAVGDKVGK